MPFYAFNKTTSLGAVQRDFLDSLRNARYKGAYILGVLNQMTNQQIADQFGYVDATTAGNAKAELQSDIGKLLNRDTNTNAAQVDDALIQMLNQFG